MNARPNTIHDATEAFVRVEWPRVLFLHYRTTPERLRAFVPREFEIETYDGSAWLTLVALTMRRFRPCGPGSILGSLFRFRGEQRFFNARTYVRHGDESGALFLWGWLSRPFGMPLPAQPLGLPCRFVNITYDHRHEASDLHGTVRSGESSFAYSAARPTDDFRLPEPGSLAEFALERYNGFFSHRGVSHVFCAWHAPWPSTLVEVKVEQDKLLQSLPCFAGAELAAAHYTPGLQHVLLGKPQPLRSRRSHHGASAFYTMP